MKVCIIASGTRGDVQPALALGLALVRAGHEVRFAGAPEDGPWVQSRGLEFMPVGDSIRGFVEKHPRLDRPMDSIRLLGFLDRQAERLFRELPEVMHGADLAVAYFINHAAQSVAEALGLPCLTLATFPQMLPSAEYPPVIVKNQRLPRGLNRPAWTVTMAVNDFAFLGTINRYRRGLGLGRIQNFWDHALGRLTILATDPLLSPMPPDIQRPYRQVGHLPLKDGPGLEAPLEEFLARGGPVVYVGFGSMPEQGRNIWAAVLAAVRSLGLRAVLSGGGSGMPEIEPAADVMVAEDVDHAALFPRLAAVVHHGGSGTTATAARAGAPQVIVPHIMDQFYWAERIASLKLGPRPIPRTALNARHLAERLGQCLSHGAYSDNARRAARELNQIDTGAAAVEVIESEYPFA